jgi:hypothetical protein
MGLGTFWAIATLSAQTAAANPAPPVPEPPPRPCRAGPAGDGEIVVCGRPYDENSPYRIPTEFRDRPSHDDADASWDPRWRDEEAVARFGGQTVGPFGYLQRGRQMHCNWLAERQEAQGRRPDCGLKPRPDDQADWQRR